MEPWYSVYAGKRVLENYKWALEIDTVGNPAR